MENTAYSKHKSRLQEIIKFAQISGFKKIGIANCICMESYAKELSDILQANGFEVFMINCRESGLDANQVCSNMSGSCCDPISQANFLNEQQTDFNLLLGLCVGHELIFQKHSQAPYSVFIVKDFATGHKTIENLQ